MVPPGCHQEDGGEIHATTLDRVAKAGHLLQPLPLETICSPARASLQPGGTNTASAAASSPSSPTTGRLLRHHAEERGDQGDEQAVPRQDLSLHYFDNFDAAPFRFNGKVEQVQVST